MGINLRVLIVTQYFWPENFSINAITKSLVEQGIHVEVLTCKPNYPGGIVFSGYRSWGFMREVYKGATLHRIPFIPRGKNKLQLTINYLSFIFSALILGPWILRKKNFDIIFVYAPSPILQALPAIFLGWLKGCPAILWVQDLWPESLSATGYVTSKPVLKMIKVIVQFIYRNVDKLLVQSRAFKDPIFALAPEALVSYHPNSVDSSFALPAEGNNPYPPYFDRKFIVVFAGNIGAAQGVKVILDAASLLSFYKDIQFFILGDGSLRGWMLEQVQARNLMNMHFPGQLPMEAMPGYMQNASALLVTLTDKPIFLATVPNKVQAYMASGKPIIASMNGEGARLVIESGAGLSCPAEDAKALSEAILFLYGLPLDERNAMGKKGRTYFQENFNHEDLVKKLIKEMNATIIDRKGL